MVSNVLLAALVVSQAGELTPQQFKEAEVAFVAFEQGVPAETVQHLAPIVARGRGLSTIDRELSRRKLPRLGDLLVESRIAAARQGLTAKLPRVSRIETLLLLPALRGFLTTGMDELVARPVMRDIMPLPDSLEEFQTMFWNLDMAEGELEDLHRAATLLKTLCRSKVDLGELDSDTRAIVKNGDVEDLLTSIEQLRDGLDERRVEMAVARLNLAAAILRREGVTPRHVLAAGTWKGDAELATAYLKKARRTRPQRSSLRESGLLTRVDSLNEELGKSAGTLTAKAKLLKDGLYWWTRGRYGAGPEVAGLVKSQTAVRSPTGRYFLTLPSETPVPSDPFANAKDSKPRQPQYQMRHLYTWSWGNRYVKHEQYSLTDIFAFDSGSSQAPTQRRCNSSPPATVVSETATYVRRSIVDNDNESLMRVVGVLEYSLALNRFDQLLNSATPEELKTMDEMVKGQKQYTIYTNLARSFPQAGTSAFPPDQPLDREDQFARRGLAWVVALARLEVGAALATFGKGNKTFELTPPGAFERAAYHTLLMDSLRLHLWAFQNDPLADPTKLRTAGRQNEQVALIYERRAKLALRLIDAARKWLGSNITPAQRAELKKNEDTLAGMRHVIQEEILRLGEGSGKTRNVINK